MNHNPLHWNRYTLCRFRRTFAFGMLCGTAGIVTVAVVWLGAGGWEML